MAQDKEAAFNDFKRTVEITRDVRFQANIRLTARARNSGYVASTLSAFVIFVSLIPNFAEITKAQGQILLAISIMISVFIIFTSLIDGSQNFYHRGELLHSCARKLATIHHELKSMDPADDSKFAEIRKQYQEALDDCPVNHENCDFWREQAAKPHLFPTNVGKWPPTLFKAYSYTRYCAAAHSWMILPIFAMAISSLYLYQMVGQ